MEEIHPWRGGKIGEEISLSRLRGVVSNQTRFIYGVVHPRLGGRSNLQCSAQAAVAFVSTMSRAIRMMAGLKRVHNCRPPTVFIQWITSVECTGEQCQKGRETLVKSLLARANGQMFGGRTFIWNEPGGASIASSSRVQVL